MEVQIMDDPGHDKTEVPCPLCAEPAKSLTEPCETCQMERDARELARATAEKYPANPPSEFNV